MENTKMTKKEMFGFIAEAMSDNESVVEFCNHEIELLERKASKSGSTKTQKENVAIMDSILECLGTVGKPVTITEFQSACPEMAQFSNQKLSALLKKLVDGGKVVKTIDKKKSFFSVA